ncbi:MAG: RNA 2',3'-cyclic phosphodiesterase [Bacillota bacterium]
MGETMRLFWAVNLPETLKSRLGGLQKELARFCPGVKWVEQENLHLTVKFLGEVQDVLVPDITLKVRESLAGLEPFELLLQGTGTFGRPPRVIWVGVGGDLEALRRVWDRVEDALVPAGFPRETRGFKPHLTLGRVREGHKVHLPGERVGMDDAAPFAVSSVDLMRSVLTPRGPVYSVLSKVVLA